MTQWEYKHTRMIPGELEDYMRNMGMLGWELVTVAPTEYGHDVFFKRPLPKDRGNV